MLYILVVAALVSFFVTLYATPWLIRYLRRIGLVVPDAHKEGMPLIPLSGGLALMAGLFSGLMTFIFFETFFSSEAGLLEMNGNSLLVLFAAATSMLIITMVGFVDDLIIERSKGESGGLKQWQKPILTLSAAIPLMVINAGTKRMLFPLFGYVDVGILYPLVIVPIGVVGAANMVNLLGGFNGIEAGMGIVYMLSLGAYAYTHGSYIAAIIAFITFAGLTAFYFYNKFPAKIFPGDSLTYLLGSVLAVIAIVGNMERVTLIVSMPFIIESILKMRGKFEKKTIGYCKNGKVFSNYDKIYSLPHILTRTGRFTERHVFWFLIVIQTFFAAIIWLI
ncbi:hypothetical protein J4231_02935 [Candidatus Woesearchaeota archaeon]|nr:hypothetical protein [Candidatus Woesearchaeota archaeon]